jgi:hypothetical protein
MRELLAEWQFVIGRRLSTGGRPAEATLLKNYGLVWRGEQRKGKGGMANWITGGVEWMMTGLL